LYWSIHNFFAKRSWLFFIGQTLTLIGRRHINDTNFILLRGAQLSQKLTALVLVKYPNIQIQKVFHKNTVDFADI
jgi:hypothetical protein